MNNKYSKLKINHNLKTQLINPGENNIQTQRQEGLG